MTAWKSFCLSRGFLICETAVRVTYWYQLGYRGTPWASRVAQGLRICQPMQETQETQVQSLGQEDALEEEMATHCIILAWKIPWTEEPGGLQSMGSQRAGHD